MVAPREARAFTLPVWRKIKMTPSRGRLETSVRFDVPNVAAEKQGQGRIGETSMKFHALFAVLILIGLTLSPLRAEDAKPALVLTYLEVSPDTVAQSRILLKTYAGEAQRAAGTVEFETFQRIGQSNHFAIVESWADANAREAFI